MSIDGLRLALGFVSCTVSGSWIGAGAGAGAEACFGFKSKVVAMSSRVWCSMKKSPGSSRSRVSRILPREVKESRESIPISPKLACSVISSSETPISSMRIVLITFMLSFIPACETFSFGGVIIPGDPALEGSVDESPWIEELSSDSLWKPSLLSTGLIWATRCLKSLTVGWSMNTEDSKSKSSSSRYLPVTVSERSESTP